MNGFAARHRTSAFVHASIENGHGAPILASLSSGFAFGPLLSTTRKAHTIGGYDFQTLKACRREVLRGSGYASFPTVFAASCHFSGTATPWSIEIDTSSSRFPCDRPVCLDVSWPMSLDIGNNDNTRSPVANNGESLRCLFLLFLFFFFFF